MGLSRDTGGSTGLRVQGSIKGAPWHGMYQDWEWEQFSTTGKNPLGSPQHCWLLATWNTGVQCTPALGLGHSHAWGDAGVEGALFATAVPRALLRKSQGN